MLLTVAPLKILMAMSLRELTEQCPWVPQKVLNVSLHIRSWKEISPIVTIFADPLNLEDDNMGPLIL